jgi:hypothetical protein
LSSFLRALKEVPQLLTLAVEGHRNPKEWKAKRSDMVGGDPLLSYLAKQRDIVVHQKALLPGSTCFVGTTEGRGVKFGIGMPLDPMQDSRIGIERMLGLIAMHGDTFGILANDHESLPCVERIWRLDRFPDEEVIDLACDAWGRMADFFNVTLEHLGKDRHEFKVERRPANEVRIVMFNRHHMRTEMLRIRKHLQETGQLKGDPDRRLRDNWRRVASKPGAFKVTGIAAKTAVDAGETRRDG